MIWKNIRTVKNQDLPEGQTMTDDYLDITLMLNSISNLALPQLSQESSWICIDKDRREIGGAMSSLH